MAKKSKKLSEEAELESSYRKIAGKYSKKKSVAEVKKGKAAITIISIIIVFSIIGFGIFAYTTDMLIFNRTVKVKTIMAGVDITGMSYEDAVNAVKNATDSTYSQLNMTVILDDKQIMLSPQITNISFDVEKAVKAACRAKASEGEYFDLVTYLNLNEVALKDELGKLIDSVFVKMIPSTYEIRGQVPDLITTEEPEVGKTMIVTLGYPGAEITLDTLYQEVIAAYNKNEFRVKQSTKYVEPIIPNIEEAKTTHCIDPISATLNKTTFEITDHKYGYSFDENVILDALAQKQYGQVIQVDFKRIRPEVTREDLEAKLFCDVLGEYTATYYSSPRTRDVNLRLSCEKINNIILLPGEVFDYNTALGERTPATGWKMANGYSGMETVLEYGGGICQASSSLYYCALIADLEIVTRHCHGFISAYMPPGMDATVSWGGPDFRFKNNMEYPIKIEASAEGGSVTVRLLGTDTKDYYVKMEYEQYNMVWWQREYVEMTKEEAAAKGYKDGRVICTPYNGSTVQTYKVKYSKATNEIISRTEEALSIYNCRNYKICKIIDKDEDKETDNPGTDTPVDPTDPTDPTESTTPTSPPETEPPSVEQPTVNSGENHPPTT